MNSSKLLTFVSSVAIILAFNPLYAKTAHTTAPVQASKTMANAKITSAEVGSLASIAVIDKNEILLGVVASNKKSSSDVMDFAKMMIDQHGSNLTQILEMANNLHAIPLTGGVAEELKAQGVKEMLALGDLQGDQFDKAYVDAMVKGHQAALDLIDHHLLATAKSDDVKKFLTDTRDVVAHHLEEAKKLQDKMKS